jgi:hypothetical protein
VALLTVRDIAPLRWTGRVGSSGGINRGGQAEHLLIWGDDIGITNLSCDSDGFDGVPDTEHRPDRRRLASMLKQFLTTFEEFPPARKAATFTIDQAVEKLQTALTSGR